MANNKWIPLLGPLALLVGCVAVDGGEPEEGQVADTDGSDESGGDPGDLDDALAACRDLPAGDSWVEGETVAPLAESSAERIAAFGDQSWELALQLLDVIPSSDHASLAASPASMYTALGLAYGRFGGECAERISAVMQYPEEGEDLHNSLGAMATTLESRAMPAQGDVDPVVVTMRQSTWEIFSDAPRPPEGLNAIYGARPHAIDGTSEEIRDVINCVIEAESDGLLKDFLPKDQPKLDTTSYDVNVSVLKAPWGDAMTEQQVQFQYADGSTASVDGFGAPFASVRHYEDEALTMVDVPLRGGALSVMIVMPPEASSYDLDAFAGSLEAETLREVRDTAAGSLVTFQMPKVAIDAGTIDYGDPLGFDCPPFTLRSVFHGAVVEMDEKGIKAAAATVAEGWGDCDPEPVDTIRVDRPFLFFVHDFETGVVMYNGRYSPEA